MVHVVLPLPKQVWPRGLTLRTFMIRGLFCAMALQVVRAAVSPAVNRGGTDLACQYRGVKALMSWEQNSKPLYLPAGEGDHFAASRNGRRPQKEQLHIHWDTTTYSQLCVPEMFFSTFIESDSPHLSICPPFPSHPIPCGIPWTYSWLSRLHIFAHTASSAWDAIPSPDHFAHQNSITAQVLILLHSRAFPTAPNPKELPFSSPYRFYVSLFAFSWGPCFYYRLHLLIVKTLLGDLYMVYMYTTFRYCAKLCYLQPICKCLCLLFRASIPNIPVLQLRKLRFWKVRQIAQDSNISQVTDAGLDPGSLRHKAWALNRWCCPRQSYVLPSRVRMPQVIANAHTTLSSVLTHRG